MVQGQTDEVKNTYVSPCQDAGSGGRGGPLLATLVLPIPVRFDRLVLASEGLAGGSLKSSILPGSEREVASG